MEWTKRTDSLQTYFEGTVEYGTSLNITQHPATSGGSEQPWTWQAIVWGTSNTENEAKRQAVWNSGSGLAELADKLFKAENKVRELKAEIKRLKQEKKDET